MNESIIAHALETMRHHLQRAASRATSATALSAIARTMTHGEAAQRMILAQMVTITEWYEPDGGPKVLCTHVTHEDGTTARTITVIGNGDDHAWACTCGGDPTAYQQVCPHTAAGWLLRAAYVQIIWRRQRVERRVALADAFEAEAVAIRAAHAAKAVYDTALAIADRASAHRIDVQHAVWRDDADAATYGVDDLDDDPSDGAPHATMQARMAA